MRFLILLDQETSSSSYFRGDSSLLEPQNELITQAKAVNPIQILIGTRIRHASLSPLVLFHSDLVCLLKCANVISGNAIASVLFGDFNPSAKLSRLCQ